MFDSNLKLRFDKYSDGLVPTIVQDATTLKVLMLGFMNNEALQKTLSVKRVTFFSRSKGRLWTKGEVSGNFLELVECKMDCDADTLLLLVTPKGPVCHTGNDTCFEEINVKGILSRLESVINDRFENPIEGSYVNRLLTKGLNKIAQKVGEEAVELVIEAKDDNSDLFLNEAADLLFHYLILLRAKGYVLADVEKVLAGRMK